MFLGQVQFFSNTSFKLYYSICLDVNWFDQPEDDTEVRLFKCCPGTKHQWLNPIVPVETLSSPHITAWAANESRLYILNFIDKRRWRDLLSWIGFVNPPEETSKKYYTPTPPTKTSRITISAPLGKCCSNYVLQSPQRNQADVQ